MREENLILLSDCLQIWAKKSSIEIPNLDKEKDKRRKYKIGRTKNGDLLGVDFKYLRNGAIEIYSARKL